MGHSGVVILVRQNDPTAKKEPGSRIKPGLCLDVLRDGWNSKHLCSCSQVRREKSCSMWAITLNFQFVAPRSLRLRSKRQPPSGGFLGVAREHPRSGGEGSARVFIWKIPGKFGLTNLEASIVHTNENAKRKKKVYFFTGVLYRKKINAWQQESFAYKGRICF